MDGGWLDVENRLGSTAGLPSCLLYDVGHWAALIEQTQLCGEERGKRWRKEKRKKRRRRRRRRRRRN